MKTYEQPTLEVVRFSVEDVITTSGVSTASLDVNETDMVQVNNN